MGTGLTAASKFLVRKSKKNLGQKKASRAPASWSFHFVLFVRNWVFGWFGGVFDCAGWTYSLLM